MNKKEIAEKAAEEIDKKCVHKDGYFDHSWAVQIVERAIAESQAPQPKEEL